MNRRIKIIQDVLLKLSFVEELTELEEDDKIINGKVKISLPKLDRPILFNFIIHPKYPFKNGGSESLKIFNTDLIEYSHVMEEGNICFHSLHCTDLEKKLISDFNLLVIWINKYIINKMKDQHYEHLILNHNTVRDNCTYYFFTDTDVKFDKREFGRVNISPMENPSITDNFISNNLLISYEPTTNSLKKSNWSKYYNDLDTPKFGLYYFLDSVPDLHNKFIIDDWVKFNGKVSTDFLNYLHNFEKELTEKGKDLLLPVFFGYTYSEEQIYWNVAMLKIGEFPLVGIAEKKDGKKTGKWMSQLCSKKIDWVNSKKVTYELFFGRGAFSKELTEKKILIIGVGAIGSILAKTLTKGGSKYLDIIDYDLKYPENVCRSEYFFATGIIQKTVELQKILIATSPFVDVNIYNDSIIEKYKESNLMDLKVKVQLIEELSNYDIIFDCTSDNDLMYILDSLDLKNININLSITNQANELVCAFNPNIYNFVNNQFTNILNNELDDLYNPTGCWEPTFRASYNDIDIKLQIAIRKINSYFISSKGYNNFVVIEEPKETCNFKVKEY